MGNSGYPFFLLKNFLPFYRISKTMQVKQVFEFLRANLIRLKSLLKSELRKVFG
jgi:hypothetical protein